MSDELSFELLRHQYGYNAANSFDEGDSVDQVQGGLFGYDDDPEAMYNPKPTSSWMPSTTSSFQGNAFQQPLTYSNDAAALAQHFDFRRAEAEGLVADYPTLTAATSTSPSFSDFHHGGEDRARSTERQGRVFDTRGGAAKIAGKAPYPRGAVFAEPEPGRRVQLVPVTNLRECPQHRHDPMLAHSTDVSKHAKPHYRANVLAVQCIASLYRSLFDFPFFNAVQSLSLPKVSWL